LRSTASPDCCRRLNATCCRPRCAALRSRFLQTSRKDTAGAVHERISITSKSRWDRKLSSKRRWKLREGLA